ncbi:calcium-binding protein CML42-like [Mangifera indica]|uniref:calcium-binding protein CML42-like n=1 Tax=Mangifera indica TaxID=29780 RepID=UPI001CFB4724|nr:calcium-binding protein CML42-like [Mangifera indica]
MEEVDAAASTERQEWNRSLSRKASSSSFRLRTSPSLNSLRLCRIFDIFDKNGDGMITVEELHKAISLLGLDADLPELESLVASYIEPGNDGLKFEDFVRLHHSLDETLFRWEEEEEDSEDKSERTSGEAKMSQEESDLAEAFKVFDEDGDGFISADELQVVLGKLGFSEGNEFAKVQQMIMSVDRNDDGRVDFCEFKNMMQGVLVRSS